MPDKNLSNYFYGDEPTQFTYFRISCQLITPRKKLKGDTLISGDTFSTFVSSIRQPIECFFNWLNRHTNIQPASMVRSLSGLLLHVFGRISAALCSLLFNS